jgi:NAD(P)-dependent dehydrogenase (short-subunit alcohol dehydrogenase family)
MGRTAYGVSKAGVIALTKYVATQYGREGVRCNAIIPGRIVIPERGSNLPPEVEAAITDNTPSPRQGVSADVAKVVAFLASDDAGFINGEQITVDGGVSAHGPMYATSRRLLIGGQDQH